MESPLLDFISVLRKNRVRISTAETLDAMEVAATVGYGNRQLLRSALAATLAKSEQEKTIFRDCFDRFFDAFPIPDQNDSQAESGPAEEDSDSDASSEEQDPGIDDGAGSEVAYDADVDAVMNQASLQQIMEADANNLAAAMSRAADAVGLSNMRFNTQKGRFTMRMMDAMGVDAIDAAQVRLRELNTPAADEARMELEARRENLREQVADYVERRFLLGDNFEGRQLREETLRNTRLSALDRRHIGDMNELVRKLAKKIASKHRRRQHKDKRGRLDIPRTLRRNMAYGGIPFHLYWKRVRKDQPKIFVLCDLSGSVATYSRFLLLFLYSLNDVVPNIRSFVFATRCSEATELFDQEPAATAIESAYKRWGLGSSDYGQSLVDFMELAGSDLDNNSTVIILGDGRCNGGDPRIDIMQQIYARSKLVLWFNPEAKTHWYTGDSEIRRYQTACHYVAVCNSLAKLERLVDHMLKVIH